MREKLARIPGATHILEALVALAPVGIQIYDAGGRSLLTNQAFRELFGSEPPPEYSVLADDIAAASGMLGLIQRAFAGEVIATPPFWYDPRELTHVKVTEGRRVAITCTFFPLRDAEGDVRYVGIVIKDVTAELQRQAREEQARAEAEFLASCSAVLSGCLDIDATLDSLAKLVVPRLADGCAIDVVTAAGGSRRVATAYADPRHEEAPERLQLPLVARGRTLGTITLTFAESGRRYGPDEVRVATDLASRAALATDNARLYQEAQEAVRIREDFLAIAGHELRTPLTAARLNLERLGTLLRATPDVEGAGNDTAARRLRAVERSVARMGGLVDQLLDVSRLGAGRLMLEVEDVDLVEVAREAIERLEQEAARAETEFRLSVPDAVVGRWDRIRLDQVLSNVLSNALKYGAGQPVDLEVHTEGGLAVVSVRDRGIGISPENQARIFEKFERAAAVRDFAGFGLGLWISREIVAAMGGRIDVASGPGAGATFTVKLPRAGAAS